MTEVHPTFFPDTGTWEISGRKAKTLAELQKKLGPDHPIVDYYPNGYNLKTIWPDEPTRSISFEKKSSTIWGKGKSHSRLKISNDESHQLTEKMVTLKKQGLSHVEIGARFGVTRQAVIGRLDRYRKLKAKNV